ncbi:MAG: oligosaccharide flippase family protein [Planctomycetota bacterium]|nr:MAG: oligosaccharide flippase family protein [Planctomycetota bacterium]
MNRETPITEFGQARAEITPPKRILLKKLVSRLSAQKQRFQILSVLIFVNFLAAVLTFVTNVKIANIVGKESFGQIAYGLALGLYGAAVVRFGFDRTLVRDLIHYPDNFGELTARSLILRLITLATVTFGLVIWKITGYKTADLTFGVMLIVIACTILSLDLRAVYDSWHRMKRHAVYNLIQKSSYFVMVWLVILLFQEKLTVRWVGTAMLYSAILYLIMQFVWASKRIDFPPLTMRLFAEAVRMGQSNLLIWFSAIACLSFGSLNQLVLKHYCGAAELGGYAAAWQIVSIGMLLLTQIARLGNPATARVTNGNINSEARCRFLVGYSAVMVMVTLPICMPALIWPETVLKLVFKPEYVTAANALRLMALYLMVFSLGLVASQYVVSVRLEKLYFVSVILGGGLGAVLCIVLIQSYKGTGAALALLISHGLSILLYWIVILRQFLGRKNYDSN